MGDHSKMAKRQQHERGRSPHRGVILQKRVTASGHASWRAFWNDPDTGRETALTLDPTTARTADNRRRWAVAKSESIQRRRAELTSGASRKTGKPLGEAVASYFEAHKGLRPRTISIYRGAMDKFEAWATAEGLKSFDDLTRGKLVGFVEQLAAEPRREASAGAKRGVRRPGGARRSPVSTNQDIRAVRTVLRALRDKELIPLVSMEELSRVLAQLKAPKPLPEFLNRLQIRQVLEAALRHDDERYVRTRAEHALGLPGGREYRYDPVAPLLVFLLLSACRAGEALALPWSAVSFEGPGRVTLEASSTKNDTDRIVSFAPSPVLKVLFEALKEQRTGPYVFGGAAPLSESHAKSALRRLTGRRVPAAQRRKRVTRVRVTKPPASFGAPPFSLQQLRATCASFLVNAPGIFGGASAHHSAKRTGHSIAVAEKHYVGLVEGIPATATTIEAAMEAEDLCAAVIASVRARAKGAAT